MMERKSKAPSTLKANSASRAVPNAVPTHFRSVSRRTMSRSHLALAVAAYRSVLSAMLVPAPPREAAPPHSGVGGATPCQRWSYRRTDPLLQRLAAFLLLQSSAAPAVEFTTVPVIKHPRSDAISTAAFAVSDTLAGTFRKFMPAI